MTTVYLDNCCFNRPFDDQLHPLVRLETEAKLLIQSEISHGRLKLVWSYILSKENHDNPFEDRRNQIATWEALANQKITRTTQIETHAKSLLSLDIKAKDALHIACAITSNADYLITTDKKLLNKTVSGITIINPIDFARRHFL